MFRLLVDEPSPPTQLRQPDHHFGSHIGQALSLKNIMVLCQAQVFLFDFHLICLFASQQQSWRNHVKKGSSSLIGGVCHTHLWRVVGSLLIGALDVLHQSQHYLAMQFSQGTSNQRPSGSQDVTQSCRGFGSTKEILPFGGSQFFFLFSMYNPQLSKVHQA